MARRVYFSFHYQRDIWRVQNVRNSQQIGTSNEYKVNGKYWFDNSLFEEAKRKGDAAIKKMIDDGMVGASVLVILFGTETFHRPWVRYELLKAMADGMGVLGVFIHGIKDSAGKTDVKGNDLFNWEMPYNGKKYRVPAYPTYDWVINGGRENLGEWVETAAKKAGR